MKCPECRYNVPDGSRFCNGCGHPLTPSLSGTALPGAFGEKLEKIQRYLPDGLVEKILSEKEKIEGERRQVTVMFCDMEGYTAIVERLGSEAAYAFMDRIYEILIHNVHRFEGTVNELTGDGIMALFGAPIAVEDAPHRALWSALSIHRQITQFSQENGEIGPVRMRIGIHTGPVVVGTLGHNLRLDFKAVGNTVNLASRMESMAEVGTTYVTEETYRLTRALFRFEAKGKKAVRGSQKAISVYKVLSAKAGVYRPRLGFERIVFAEMVGRDRDLCRLERQLEKVVDGQGSVVNIIGEAGIGKTRLVEELKQHELITQIALFKGRAISIGKNLSFHPIIDVLRQWAEIREDDGDTVAITKLKTAIEGLFPDDADEVLPFIATLMRVKLSGSYAEKVRDIEGDSLEKLIFKSIRELLIRASAQTPLVMVSEDLHWADTSSIEFMASLFRLAETHPILFVNVFRPGHKETEERIVALIKERFPKRYVEILLAPLDAKTSETLIAHMLHMGKIHHTFIGKIVQRAGGNPFFLEEIIRSLIDQHLVILENGRFHLTDKIGRITIPHTINDVLMARFDRLEAATRDLVRTASVIGGNFFYRILREVSGRDTDLKARLSHLKAIQIICERQRMGEVEFFFQPCPGPGVRL